MRKQVEYYSGKQITRRVLRMINIIDLKRMNEAINEFQIEEVKTLKELCKIHDTNPEDEHIILGEDWYIVYTNVDEDIIDIKDWVAIHNSKEKFAQTMEMFSALKNILLSNANSYIYAILRHSTSYPFYKKLLDEGLVEESIDILDLDENTEILEKIKEQILTDYDSLYDYLDDENRDKYGEQTLDDHIYHDVSFNVTEKFIHRYKK